MGEISNVIANEVLDHIFNGAGAAYTPPATVYLGLSTTEILPDGTGNNEPSGNGYARKAITFGAASNRSITQSADVTFDQASGPWGTLAYFGIWSALTAGTLLAVGTLGTPKSVVAGNTPSVASGQCVISFQTLGTKGTGENITDYLANKILDFVFRNQTFTQPAIYVGLWTATLDDASTGATAGECSGNNYARKLVNANGGSAPTWNLSVSQIVDNTNTITMPTSSGSWGTVVSMALLDAASSGNMLCYDNTNVVDQAVALNDTVQFAAGALEVSLT